MLSCASVFPSRPLSSRDRRASQKPRHPKITHPATDPITAPAIQVLFCLFSVDVLALVVEAGACVVGEAPGVAEVCNWVPVVIPSQRKEIYVGLMGLTGTCGYRSGSKNLRCRPGPTCITKYVYVRSVCTCVVVYCHECTTLTRCTTE